MAGSEQGPPGSWAAVQSLPMAPAVWGWLSEGAPGAVGGVMEVILAELTSTKPTVEALPSHSPSLFPNLVIHPAVYLFFYPSIQSQTQF